MPMFVLNSIDLRSKFKFELIIENRIEIDDFSYFWIIFFLVAFGIDYNPIISFIFI